MDFLSKLFKALFEREYLTEIQYIPLPPLPVTVSVPPVIAPTMTISVTDLYDDWSQPKNAYHNVRVLCDRANLSLAEKNLLCACIYQESTFLNSAVGKNSTSTDWGLCQINDYFHIGKGKDFPSVEYVKTHPKEVVEWMIGMYKAGNLYQWSSYKSKAYLKWLKPNSPLWALKT